MRTTDQRANRLFIVLAGFFLTNALIGAWPVVALDGRPLSPDPAVREFNAWLDRA